MQNIFYEGDTVQLKSGGAEMLIERECEIAGENYYSCIWHDLNKIPQRHDYKGKNLTHVTWDTWDDSLNYKIDSLEKLLIFLEPNKHREHLGLKSYRVLCVHSAEKQMGDFLYELAKSLGKLGFTVSSYEVLSSSSVISKVNILGQHEKTSEPIFIKFDFLLDSENPRRLYTEQATAFFVMEGANPSKSYLKLIDNRCGRYN